MLPIISSRQLILQQMDQIKLFKLQIQRDDDIQNTYEFQQIVTNNNRKKKQEIELLQPWFEESERNPFISFKSQRIKKVPSPRIKKQGSLSITRNWKSQQKIKQKTIVHRESKVLPIMDVGELNKIRKSLYPGRTISKLDLNSANAIHTSRSKSKKQLTLPSVTRQLNIERKIFLLKQINTSANQYSPQKSHRIRSIIQQSRK